MSQNILCNLLALSALSVTLWIAFGSATSCPSVCVCKWKGGKQTVECLERALITVPENIDGETQVLDMSGNNLQIIPREAFHRANLTNLQKVYLKNCRIGQIGDRAFRGLTNLIELDLSHNLLTGVPSAAFEDTPFLRYLSLANNPIQKIESNAFRLVAGMAKIDLSHCDIQVISPNAFERLESLEWLKINGNKLTELHPKTVDAISKLHGVELHDNPWLCDCKLRSAKEWLSRNAIPYSVAPVCSKPDRISGMTFAELSMDDFACRPEILPTNRYVEASTGTNATVTCKVGAVPSASVHWYWNGRHLLNNSAFSAFQKVFIFEEGKFEKSSSLVLTNALETDSGEFYCVAENRAGTAEANFSLNVYFRTAGLASLGNGQIAGLTIALVVLLLAILTVAIVLLLRFRRRPYTETKTPAQSEASAINANGMTATEKAIRKPPEPNERTDARSSAAVIYARSAKADSKDDAPQLRPSGNNPDIICDARPGAPSLRPADPRPPSGEYSRAFASDPLYPSDSWDGPFYRRGPEDANDRTPIIAEDEEDRQAYSRTNPNDYPRDYGLPILDGDTSLADSSPATCQQWDPKALRLRQRGVPVLPPVTGLKRAWINSRSSPDEGYQEGCGTDV